MADQWVQVRVVLESGPVEVGESPGRIFLVSSRHTFEDFAEAIDNAFGRWDQSHLHLFELADGRRFGPIDPEEDDEWADESAVRIAEVAPPGSTFSYTFDLGDEWVHACTVAAAEIDIDDALDDSLEIPMPIFGWGWIPDQYGRASETD